MSIYKDFFKKQQEIADLIQEQEKKEMELTEIKREIYKKHRARFKEKPIGRTVVKDGDFEIIYNCEEKITILESLIKKDGFKHSCIVEKTTPAVTKIALDKREFKKLADDEREIVSKYLAIEAQKPTINVVIPE